MIMKLLAFIFTIIGGVFALTLFDMKLWEWLIKRKEDDDNGNSETD